MGVGPVSQTKHYFITCFAYTGAGRVSQAKHLYNYVLCLYWGWAYVTKFKFITSFTSTGIVRVSKTKHLLRALLTQGLVHGPKLPTLLE